MKLIFSTNKPLPILSTTTMTTTTTTTSTPIISESIESVAFTYKYNMIGRVQPNGKRCTSCSK